MLAAVLLTALAAAAHADDNIPPALKRMLESRRSIERLELVYTTRYLFSDHSGGEPYKRTHMVEGSRVARFDHGLPDGVTGFAESGEPVSMPMNSLVDDDGFWETFQGGLLTGELREAGTSQPSLPELRALGLWPFARLYTHLDNAVEPDQHANDPGRFRAFQRDGLEVVERAGQSGMIVRWFIDPDKDWNPVRVECEYEGKILGECVSDYTEVDGAWWPVSVRFYNSTGNLHTAFDTESVRINNPEMAPLTPATIGVVSGTAVFVQSGPRTGQFTYIPGEGLVDVQEAARREKAGLFERDPKLVAFMARLREEHRERQRLEKAGVAASQPSAPTPTTRPASQPAPLIVPNRVDDAWEAYTKEFIRKYQLDADQTQAALRILRDCQERRTQYLRSRQQEITRCDLALKSPGDPRQKREWSTRLEQLLTPVHAIFEEQLKPRLENLPTRAQRARLVPVATQPAAAP